MSRNRDACSVTRHAAAQRRIVLRLTSDVGRNARRGRRTQDAGRMCLAPRVPFTVHPVRGVTLTELLIGVVLAGLVMVAISNTSTTTSKLTQTTESLLTLERDASYAFAHMHDHFLTAYYVWFDSATPPSIVWLQQVNPSTLPPQPSDLDNWQNFTYQAYQFTGGQLVYYENVKPLDSAFTPVPPGMRQTVLASQVLQWTVTRPDPTGELNRFQVTLTATDPAGHAVTIGPTEFVSRQMAAKPPTGWAPPVPP